MKVEVKCPNCNGMGEFDVGQGDQADMVRCKVCKNGITKAELVDLPKNQMPCGLEDMPMWLAKEVYGHAEKVLTNQRAEFAKDLEEIWIAVKTYNRQFTDFTMKLKVEGLITDIVQKKITKYKEDKMGDIANQIIKGEVCELCHMPFIEAHGYPVTCDECWADVDDKYEEEHQKALHNRIDAQTKCDGCNTEWVHGKLRECPGCHRNLCARCYGMREDGRKCNECDKEIL